MKKLLNIVIASVMLLPMSVSAFTAEIHEITSDNRKAVMTVWIRHFFILHQTYQPLFSSEALMSEFSYVDHAMPNMVD